MVETLLTTKLFIPLTRSTLVSRKRLVDQLNKGTHSKLTLVSAPAGYGKTTLVSEWIDGCGLPVVWLSLDAGDNDLSRFLTYLVAALSHTGELQFEHGHEILDMVQAPQLPAVDVILSALINLITQISDHFLFVLDDYHLIENQAIHDALTFLLEHLPPRMHLVIATREDPLFSFGRLRVQGQLIELRAADLRFTTEEAAEFLNQVMQLDLSPEDIEALERRTEGWIAGLQLAALSMQGQRDTAALIKSFTGSHRFVLDYLIEEVLDQQPAHMLSFLLQTSILTRLSGALCNELTETNNSQETLEALERANLFILPLDNEHKWYRYHHLFAELLERRAASTLPESINSLHLKAAAWYEKNGYLSEAIHHALKGEDIQTATRLIEKGALEALERSNFSFIFNSIKRLPDNTEQQSPWLYIYHTLALLLTGQVDEAYTRLANTDWLTTSISMADESKQQEMLGYIAGAKTVLAGWERNAENTTKFTNQARQYLPEDHWILAYCYMMVGADLWEKGKLSEAHTVFEKAYAIGKKTGNIRVILVGSVYLSYTLELGGKLQQAIQIHQNAFKFSKVDGREFPIACYTYIELGRLLYKRNELGLAQQHLEQGIKLAQRISDSRVEKLGLCFLARVYMAQKDFSNVEKTIEMIKQNIGSQEIFYDMRGGEFPQVWVWLKQNKLDEVRKWLLENDVDLESAPYFTAKLTHTMHARAMIALGEEYAGTSFLEDAQSLLNKLLQLAEPNGWNDKLVEIFALQALAYQAQGDLDQALLFLEKALTLGEPQGYIRSFVDEGPAMEALLKKIKTKDEIIQGYTQNMLAAFSSMVSQSVLHSKQPLIEPLSERELEVLQLISEGLSNKEIASRLYLSLNTVKVHTRNIYGKLGTNNRTQAAAQARELGLLDTN